MKRILTLLFLFFSFYSFAQNWADSGAVWHYGSGGLINQGYVEIAYTQDTIILGYDAEKLKVTKRGFNYLNGQLFEFVMGFEYTYSDSDHVYILHDGEFEILFDFSAELGDTLIHYLPDEYNIQWCDSIGISVVSATGTEMINGEELRWYETEYVDGISAFDNRIYEKIGALDYMFPTNYLCGIDEDYYNPLRCYEDDTFELYQNPDYDGECDFIYEYPIPNYFENNPEWCLTYGYGFGDECSDYFKEVQYIDGQVMIDSLEYYKLYSRGLHSGQDNWGSYPYCNFSGFYYNYFVVYLRQEGRKIYARYDENGQDNLLYDFSLSVGDTIITDNIDEDFNLFPEYNGPYIITSIDSIFVDNNFYKRFYFSTPDGPISFSGVDYLIEGIGHHMGFLFRYDYFFEHYNFLHAFKKADVIYYEFPESEGECDFAVSIDEFKKFKTIIDIYPNPVNDQLQLKIANSIQVQNIRIYSISGKVLMNLSPSKSIDVSALPSGMYLLEVESVDGYKEVKRFVRE